MARDYPDTFAPEPVDRVAGRVISRGTHYEIRKPNNNREFWTAPPDVTPACYTPEPIRDLIGQRKGSLVVVGYLGRRRGQSGAKRGQILLVRCDCGIYEERKAQRWRKHDGWHSWCQLCEIKDGLKRRHLSFEERDKAENKERIRRGLPPKTRTTEADRLDNLLRRRLLQQFGVINNV